MVHLHVAGKFVKNRVKISIQENVTNTVWIAKLDKIKQQIASPPNLYLILVLRF